MISLLGPARTFVKSNQQGNRIIFKSISPQEAFKPSRPQPGFGRLVRFCTVSIYFQDLAGNEFLVDASFRVLKVMCSYVPPFCFLARGRTSHLSPVSPAGTGPGPRSFYRLLSAPAARSDCFVQGQVSAHLASITNRWCKEDSPPEHQPGPVQNGSA